jgi:hypothetical protein
MTLDDVKMRIAQRLGVIRFPEDRLEAESEQQFLHELLMDMCREQHDDTFDHVIGDD